jgi:hypothetical protein
MTPMNYANLSAELIGAIGVIDGYEHIYIINNYSEYTHIPEIPIDDLSFHSLDCA